jgi:hypothetical protein
VEKATRAGRRGFLPERWFGFALKIGEGSPQCAKRFNDVTNSSPSSPSGQRALGLAWSIPVLLAVYIGIGFWLGRWLGSPIAGVLVGWLAGMAAVFYEIRKVLNSGEGTAPAPPKGGAT